MLLVCIMNWENEVNAIKLRDSFAKYLDIIPFIVDSGSKSVPEGAIPTDTGMYMGLFNKAAELFLSSNKNACLFIASDIIANDSEISNLVSHISTLSTNIGVYTPVVNGRSHDFLKCKNTHSLRDIPFAEGMIFVTTKSVMQKALPMDDNKYGWGADIWVSWVAKQLNLRVVCDDTISVYHPAATEYPNDKAEQEMNWWITTRGQEFEKYVKKVLGRL